MIVNGSGSSWSRLGSLKSRRFRRRFTLIYVDLGPLSGSAIRATWYEKAIVIKPDFADAWYNWGLALLSLGEMKEDESLLTESIKKCRKALEIKPESHDAWSHWGIALSCLG